MGEEATERVHEFPSLVVRPLRAAELRQLALEREVFDEEGLTKYEPYFFSAEISNGRLDSHFTRMAQSTLKNFAVEAQAGVSFLYAHDNRELIGRSFGGQFIGGQGNGVARVVADFYVTPGLRLGQTESDQIIRAIDSGTLRDVSAGFYGGEWICSICGNDVWDWQNCRHYPGCKSEVQADGKTEIVVCTADVGDAHLAEESGVYKGSTPGAMIAKAERQAKEGTLEPKTRAYLERHLRIHLPDKRVSVPGHSEERTMPEPKDETPKATESAAEEERQVSELLTRAGITDATVKTPLAAARALATECERLKPLADVGTQYRADLSAAVVREAVRAGFGEETYKGLCASASVETMKRILEELGAKGDSIFRGGRQTVDESEESKPARRKAPAAAFQA